MLESKEGEKKVFKLAGAREKRNRNLGKVRCIKDEDDEVLIQDVKVQERWQSYMSYLMERGLIPPNMACKGR